MRDPAAAPLLESLPEDGRFATWHLVRPDGSLAGYGAGLVELAQAMRLTRPLARVLAHLPHRTLEALYALIARHRSTLGRLVPDGPAPRR
jgi:predicted DCC family thiol-disulfide oxidoreductase YuxK